MSGWITLSRLRWVLNKFNENAKPRFVLERDGAQFIVYNDENRGRIVLKFQDDDQLDEYLDAYQKGDQKLINKFVNKYKIDDKKLSSM